MEDVKSNHCLFCFWNNPSWANECEYCKKIILPTRNKHNTPLEWKIYSFDSSSRALDSKGTKSTAFRRYLGELRQSPLTAIRVGDVFLLAHYPEEGSRYSVKRDDGVNVRDLDVGGEEDLLFAVVEQVLINGTAGSGQ